MIWEIDFGVRGGMAPEVFDPALRDLAVGITRHRRVQDLPKLRTESLVVEVHKYVALRMSNIEGAHSRSMPLFNRVRQEIIEE
jgi:hypothetical protein